MSFGLLFAGQGTQHPQMFGWLQHDALVGRTEAALGVPDWRAALQDAGWAARNRHAQVLLTGIALAAWNQLAPQLPAPAAVAGYSVGELAAFCAAGVFDAAMAIALAARRAELMDRCAQAAPGGLLAVTGLSSAALEAVCNDAGVSVAIRIADNVVVLGGRSQALDVAQARATALGASCSPLNVELASHTPAMQAAAEGFATLLHGRELRRAAVPLFDNLAGEPVRDGAQAARSLSLQIARTVQWAAVLDAVHARRPACVLEIGPGSALAAMWNRRHPDVPARCADDFRSADALVHWVTSRIAAGR